MKVRRAVASSRIDDSMTILLPRLTQLRNSTALYLGLLRLSASNRRFTFFTLDHWLLINTRCPGYVSRLLYNVQRMPQMHRVSLVLKKGGLTSYAFTIHRQTTRHAIGLIGSPGQYPLQQQLDANMQRPGTHPPSRSDHHESMTPSMFSACYSDHYSMSRSSVIRASAIALTKDMPVHDVQHDRPNCSPMDSRSKR